MLDADGYELSHEEAMKQHRRKFVRKRWKGAFTKVARRRYAAALEKDEKDEANRGRAVYRMGALHFYEGEYAEAVPWLDKACKLKSRRKDFRCLRMCGQAHMRCFDEDGKHERLEKAQKRLYKALKLMPVGIESFITLPHSLMELANLYERFGAFEGALDIMGRVTEFFPGYGKYEEVMHRCVVVMHHLANLPGSMTQTLMQCGVEFLDVLMEERSGGRGVHPLGRRPDVLLLYARCCELEGSRVNKQKGQACYEQLFKRRQEDGEEDTMRHPNWRVWIGDPATLLALGREMAELGEPTLAAALFEQGVELISERMARYRKLGITDPVGFDTFLVIARCYASFQDMETALHYAKQAYELREFDPTVRDLLSEWSDEYDLLFKTQLEAALGVQRHWRKRIWSQDYYQRYYAICVDRWERELKEDYWNLALRAKLTYFCKRKWRMVFLFEDATAARIQKWKRDVEGMRHWRAAMREAHLKRCAALFSKWKRHPYDIAVRQECLELAEHRKTPPGHKLKELQALFDEQLEAVVKLQGQYQRLLAYRRVLLLKEAHQVELKLKRAAGAITIQCGLRCHWARVEVAERRVRLEHAKTLAVILQRTYRHRRGIWAQMKKMADEARAIRIAEARRAAAVLLQRTWRGFVARRLVTVTWPHRALRIQRLWRGFTVRRDIWRYKVAMATRLQRLWREKVERERWESLLRRLLEAKHAPPAPLSESLTRRLRENRSRDPLPPPPPPLPLPLSSPLAGEATASGSAAAGSSSSSSSFDPFAIDSAFAQLMPWKRKRRRRRRKREAREQRRRRRRRRGQTAADGEGGEQQAEGANSSSSSSSSSSGGGGNRPPLSPGVDEEPESNGAGEAAENDDDDDLADDDEIVEEEEVEWVPPSYRSPGLPGTPAWNVALQTTELAFVAEEYRAPLMADYEQRMRDAKAQEAKKAEAEKAKSVTVVVENPQGGGWGGGAAGEGGVASTEAAVAAAAEGAAEVEGGVGAAMSEEEKAQREQERRDKVDWRASMGSRGGLDPSEAHRQKMLSGDAYFGAVDGAMLAGLLRHQNCRLETVVLLGADLADHDAGVQVAAALSTNRTLRTLVLGGCKLHPDSVAALATALQSHNFTLRELYLDANPIGEALGEGGVGRLMEGVVADYFASQFGALHTLSLAKMGLDDFDAEALGRGLGGCVEGHLHRLSLGDNFISDDGALALLRGLRHANRVTAGRQQDALWATVEKNKTLSPAKRSHESMRVRIGSGRRGLRELDLSNNRITDLAAVPWIEHCRDDLRVGTVGGSVLADFSRRGPSVGLNLGARLGAVSEEGGGGGGGGDNPNAAEAPWPSSSLEGGDEQQQQQQQQQTVEEPTAQLLTGRSDRSAKSHTPSSARSQGSSSSSSSSTKNHHWGDAHPNRHLPPDLWPAWMDEGAAGSGGSLLRVALAGNLIKDSVAALWGEAAARNPSCEVELQGNMFRQEQDAAHAAAAARAAGERRKARQTREAARLREATEALAKATGGTHPKLLREKAPAVAASPTKRAAAGGLGGGSSLDASSYTDDTASADASSRTSSSSSWGPEAGGSPSSGGGGDDEDDEEEEEENKDGSVPRSGGGTPDDEAKARRRRGWKRRGVAAGSKVRQQRRAEERQEIRRRQKGEMRERQQQGMQPGQQGGKRGLGDLGVGDALARMADWSDSEDEDEENDDYVGGGVRLPRLSPEKQDSASKQKKKPASLGMLIASSGGGGGGGGGGGEGGSSRWEHPDEARKRELAKPRLMQGFEPHRGFGADVAFAKAPPERWEDVMGPVLVDRSPDKAHSGGGALAAAAEAGEDIDEDDEEAVARRDHRRSIRLAAGEASPAAAAAAVGSSTEEEEEGGAMTSSTAGRLATPTTPTTPPTVAAVGSPANLNAMGSGALYGGIGDSGRFGSSGLTSGGLGSSGGFGGGFGGSPSGASSPSMHGPSMLPTAAKFTAERMAVVSNRIMRTQHLERLGAAASRRGKLDRNTSTLHARYVLPDDPEWKAGAGGKALGKMHGRRSPAKKPTQSGGGQQQQQQQRGPLLRGSQHERVIRHYEYGTGLPPGVVSPVGKGMDLSRRLSAGEKAPRSKPAKPHPAAAFEASLRHHGSNLVEGAHSGGAHAAENDFGGFIHEEDYGPSGGTFHPLPSPTKKAGGLTPVRTGSL